MGGAGRVRDGGLGVAQVGGDGDHAGRIDHLPGVLLAALHLEAHHGTETALLTLGQRVLRMAGQACVVDAFDLRLLLQPLGDGLGAGAVGLHAHPEGFQALDEQPGVERAERRAGGAQEADHLLHQLGGAGHHAAQAATLAVDVFGGRMNDDIGAQRQRLLQHRGAEAVVHREQRAVGVGHVGQCGDVHQLGQRVGRRFDDEQLGVRLAGRRPGIQVGQRRVVHRDAEALEVLVEQADGGTEHAARHQHMVAGAAQAHHHGQDGRHAGGGADRLLGPFHGGDALLEGAHRGIGVAGVDIAGLFAGKARGGIGRAAEHVAGGEEQRLAVLTFGRAVLARTHRQGIQTRVAQITVEPAGIPFFRHCITPWVAAHSARRPRRRPGASDQLLYRSMIALTAFCLLLVRSLRAWSMRCR